MVMGCSQNRQIPVEPSKDLPDSTASDIFINPGHADIAMENTGWKPLYAGQLIPDGKNGFQLVYDRETLANLNVTGIIMGAGAFSFQIVSISGNVFEIDVTIENPSSIMAYDVRLIFNNIGNNEILNADSYTTLFASGISPYISFAKEDPERLFPVGPGVSDTRKVFIKLNGSGVGFVIAASLPSNCDEPYEIDYMNVIGELNDQDGGWAVLQARVLDHQWDFEQAYADLTTFTGHIEYMVANTTDPNMFEIFFSNELLIPWGNYTIWVAAKSKGSPMMCYNRVNVRVSGGVDPPVVTITTPSTDPYYTIERFTTVAGNITNFTGTEAIMDINGDQQTIPVSSGTFSEIAVLPQSENLVKVIAENPGGIGEDSVTIYSSAASADLWVRLTWDTDDTDVDLYITEPGPNNFTCWYLEKVSPDSGAQLDVDDVDGYGPEHYYLSVAEGHILYPGIYEIDVHYYSDHETGTLIPTTATVLIYKDNSYYGEYNHFLDYDDSSQNGPENRRMGLQSWWDNVADVDLN